MDAEHSTRIPENISKPQTPRAVHKLPVPVQVPDVNGNSCTIYEARDHAALNSGQTNRYVVVLETLIHVLTLGQAYPHRGGPWRQVR